MLFGWQVRRCDKDEYLHRTFRFWSAEWCRRRNDNLSPHSIILFVASNLLPEASSRQDSCVILRSRCVLAVPVFRILNTKRAGRQKVDETSLSSAVNQSAQFRGEAASSGLLHNRAGPQDTQLG